MGINAGDLDREIVIQTAPAVQSDSGEITYDWENATLSETIFAEWVPAGTAEVFRAQQRLEGVIDGLFKTYWRDDVTPHNTRILWDGKAFDVRPPVEGGRHEWIEIPVTALA